MGSMPGIAGPWPSPIRSSSSRLPGPTAGRTRPFIGPGSPDGRLTRCETGLPAWFSSNVDTGCLAAEEGLVVIGDEAGTVFASADRGESWGVIAADLPRVTCVAIG